MLPGQNATRDSPDCGLAHSSRRSVAQRNTSKGKSHSPRPALCDLRRNQQRPVSSVTDDLSPSGLARAVSHLARRPCFTTLHQTHDARWSPLVLMIAGTCPWKSFSTPICHHVFFPLLPRVAYRLPGRPAFDVRSRQIVVDHATQVDWFAFNSYQSPKNREDWASKSSYVSVYAAANTRIHPVSLS